MKTEFIKEFEEKYQRSRFLQDTGIGDMHGEQGCYCDEYVEFLEQKLANGDEQSASTCNIPHVSHLLAFLVWYRKNEEYHTWSVDIAVEQYFKANCG